MFHLHVSGVHDDDDDDDNNGDDDGYMERARAISKRHCMARNAMLSNAMIRFDSCRLEFNVNAHAYHNNTRVSLQWCTWRLVEGD